MKPRKPEIDRRDFIGSVAALGAATVSACATRRVVPAAPPDQGIHAKPVATGRAPAGPLLKAGLVGCGGRGRGAAANFLAAGPNLQIAALADVFPDRVAEAQRRLKDLGQEIPDSHCFVGFDAYQKLLDSGVDVVLHATPPHFRPAHFAAAVEARKHVFIEKPVSVDVPGALSVLRTADKAATLGLSVLTGTQLRRELVRMEVQKRVRDGAVGDIQALRAFRNQGALWYRTAQPGWSDMEYMIRDWVNWTWLSGDIIVEQHIHHLDAMLWILGGTPPAKAVGMGARLRRPTGDQYDFFSVDYAFNNGVHLHTTIRQLNGCANVREEVVVGTKGVANLDGTIYDRSGKLVWKYDGPVNDALVQEHADWVTAIRVGKPMNTVRDTTTATLMAIMGRDSAYTGKAVDWDELLASTNRLGPEQYAMGPVSIKPTVPIPGVEPGPPAQ